MTWLWIAAGGALGASARYGLAGSVHAFAIGMLAAFTTFSTFAYEAVAMLRNGEWGVAGGYVAASALLGLAGVLLGPGLAGRLLAGR